MYSKVDRLDKSLNSYFNDNSGFYNLFYNAFKNVHDFNFPK